jgi:hypothetical protein
MAKASRNERRKARIKRTNSLLKRQLGLLSQEAHKSYVYLMAVLAQSGGELKVTKGTIQQALENVRTLGYQIVAGETEQDLIIRQVVHSGPVEQSDALPEVTDPNSLTDEEIEHAVFANDGGPAPVDPALG